MLAYSLNASPCFCKLAKYLTRDKDDKKIQLEKAGHCIELERDLQRDESLYGMEWDYFASNVKLEHKEKIKAFAIQFDTPQAIYHCLAAMFIGDYEESILELKELKDLLCKQV